MRSMLHIVFAFLAVISGANAAPSPCAGLAAQFDASPDPVFLASYPGTAIRELKGAAFLYDNAAATIALLGCNDIARARRIGDAILFAQDRDRFWHDGRLRNAYLAGPPASPVKLAGWWDATLNRWVEDRYQVGSDTGNLAWTMLALLALDRATQDARYRAGAARLGVWLERWRDSRGPGGFTGGVFGHEPKPEVLTWKSTEHNTDLTAAFRALARATGDTRWLADAAAAEAMVRASWLPDCRCFAAGTGLDGATRNPVLALDAQVWPLLALDDTSRYRAVAVTMRKRLARDGGYAYGEARAGLWTEGTAQAALLTTLVHHDAEAAGLARAVAAMRAPGGAYYAATASAQATGFMLDTDPTQPRRYFHIAALAPLAWAALAERKFNPFR